MKWETCTAEVWPGEIGRPVFSDPTTTDQGSNPLEDQARALISKRCLKPLCRLHSGLLKRHWSARKEIICLVKDLTLLCALVTFHLRSLDLPSLLYIVVDYCTNHGSNEEISHLYASLFLPLPWPYQNVINKFRSPRRTWQRANMNANRQLATHPLCLSTLQPLCQRHM
jgi:hypothetical protein